MIREFFNLFDSISELIPGPLGLLLAGVAVLLLFCFYVLYRQRVRDRTRQDMKDWEDNRSAAIHAADQAELDANEAELRGDTNAAEKRAKASALRREADHFKPWPLWLRVVFLIVFFGLIALSFFV